jgi:hypothetical protein
LGSGWRSFNGDVFKIRVARPGEGKSGGYRIIVLFRSGERTFFVHGYAKSELSDISEKEERRYKLMAKYVMSFTEKELEKAIKTGEFIEIKEEKDEEVSR